jgi:hypothetical protein
MKKKLINMKLKLLLAIIPLVLITTSCEKDFLEPRSISSFDTNYVFSNVDDARIAVNAVYASFNHDAFRSRLSNNMTGCTDIETQSGWASSSDRYQIWNLEATVSNRDLDIVWTSAYAAIRDANVAIEGITASGNLESSDVSVRNTFNHLLGEAHTLRAYWYSMLIYYFGDVPYSIEAPKAGSNFNIPKTHRNTILSGEIQALIDIEANMQWADQLPYGIEQVNREYTLGMIARLALQRGGYYLTPELNMVRDGDYLDYYAIAKDYTKKLMTLKDRPLPSDFRQIFLNQCQFEKPLNEDILFEVPFAKGGGDVGWNIGIRVDGGSSAKHDYGSGSNYMHMPPTYYMSFDSEDIRREVTCGLYKINVDAEHEHVGAGNISQGKWSRWFLRDAPGKESAKGTGINWPMMRYADVLLMYAEAENELNGPTMEAQNALKRVRQRAFGVADWPAKVDGYITQASASKEAFFNAIVDERAWEFGGEMIRKYELIRWNLYYDKVVETVEGLKKLRDDSFEFAEANNLPDYQYWKVDASGNFVVYNPDFYTATAPDASWTRSNFLRGLNDNTFIYREWITRDWANYIDQGPKPGVVRYIFPIPTLTIENSQGVLKNDGYGFNN